MKVLVVDDSGIVREVIGAQLRENGHEILFAEDGMDAIQTAFREMPELMILDVNMPKVNGWQVCRLLKDNKLTKHIVIIIGTSRGSSTVADPESWSSEIGADDYFEKDLECLDDMGALIAKYEALNLNPKPKKGIELPENEILLYMSSLLDEQMYKRVTQLKELDERKNAFVANVSHEFRSPLGIIKSSYDGLTEPVFGELTDQQKKFTAIGIRTVNRLLRLVNDMLDLEKIASGKVYLNFEKINLQELVNETIESYGSILKEKNQIVENISKLKDPIFAADRDKITQVIINVLNNAIKYTDEGGAIEISTDEFPGKVCIRIKDSGQGMQPEDIGKIFNKFERVTTEKQEGTGLGLPVTKQLVELHFGTITATSEFGKGSEFTIELPRNMDKAL
jgi:two-component system, sensor histidine kinase and response regulator